MDALKKNSFSIYFGGTYEEDWSDAYRLNINYSDRICVDGTCENGIPKPLGELPDIPFAYEYFCAVANMEKAVKNCFDSGFGLDKLYLKLDSSSSIAPIELFRRLLDDSGCDLKYAADITTRCFTETEYNFDKTILEKLNPRLASLSDVLKGLLNDSLCAIHDSRSITYRSPLGAVKTDEPVTLTLRCFSEKIKTARVIINSPHGDFSRLMTKENGQFSTTLIFPQTGAMSYCFLLNGEDKEFWVCPDFRGFFGQTEPQKGGMFRLTVYKSDFKTPDWFKSSIMYQIFPDRFALSDDDTAMKGIEYHKALGQTPELHASINELPKYLPRQGEKNYAPDDFYGGTLKGIEQKLPYLKDLGISVIYLNPIVEARSNHRYDTSDYMRVDPILGSNEDYTNLCNKAAELGIRIINDGVFSHTGADSKYFDLYKNYGGGACEGEASPYYAWYDFRSFPDDYRCWWNIPDLPEVEERNKIWQNYVITDDNSVVKHWIRLGSSGWRLDVADELPDDVLSLIRSNVKAENSETLVLGEVWEDAVTKCGGEGPRNYILGHSLDSVMNYPLRTNILEFLHGRIDSCDLCCFLESQKLNYPEPAYYSLMNLLGTHDVERIKTNLTYDFDVNSLSRDQQAQLQYDTLDMTHAEELEKLAVAIQFMVPGVPSIYYGDECGMTGARDPFNRRPFVFEDSELFRFYKTMCSIRNENVELTKGDVLFTPLSSDVLKIQRTIDDSTITALISRSSRPYKTHLEGKHTNCITGEEIAGQIQLEPYSCLFFK